MSSDCGFPPIVSLNAATGVRVMILGSLPSQQSLIKQEYYGNPRNVFWGVMGELFDAGPDLSYSERTERLSNAGILLWDVLYSSVRAGSMDAAIDQSTAIANDFAPVFEAHPELNLVCFNGKKAADLYRRLVVPCIGESSRGLEYVTMPSTSPAHASMTFEEKLQRWSLITKFI